MAYSLYLAWQVDSTERSVYADVHVLCMIPCMDKDVASQADMLMATWGKRCYELVLLTETSHPDVPSALAVNIKDAGSNNLTAKVYAGFKLVHDLYINEYDWFMKADTDTYVIMENLWYFLHDKDPNKAIAYGKQFKFQRQSGYYMSAGAGYIVSREALKVFTAKQQSSCEPKPSGIEDIEFGKCLAAIGIEIGDSRDSQGLTRFHCFLPHYHFRPDPISEEWFQKRSRYGVDKQMPSDSTISFHYVSRDAMFTIEGLLYHVWPYGTSKNRKDNNFALVVKSIPV